MEEDKKKILYKVREQQIDRIYLDVPYNKKDLAKEYGAWWDSKLKRWYAPKKSNGKFFRSVNYDKLYSLFSFE